MSDNNERESVKVLRECIDLQLKKSQDYQNPASSVKQAMHYRRGIDTIHDMLHQKMLRALSLLEAARYNDKDPSSKPNFESLEDTYKDIINYSSFAVTYLRGAMDGQDANKNIFNEPNPKVEETKYYVPEPGEIAKAWLATGEVRGVTTTGLVTTLPFTSVMDQNTEENVEHDAAHPGQSDRVTPAAQSNTATRHLNEYFTHHISPGRTDRT